MMDVTASLPAASRPLCERNQPGDDHVHPSLIDITDWTDEQTESFSETTPYSFAIIVQGTRTFLRIYDR